MKSGTSEGPSGVEVVVSALRARDEVVVKLPMASHADRVMPALCACQTVVFGEMSLSWHEQLAALRQRMVTLRDAGPLPDPITRAEGERNYARLRDTARELFAATVTAYRGLCAGGYPVIDDNEIPGTGGAIGIRFDEHHSFFFTFERVRRKKKLAKEESGALGPHGEVPRKRMPGDPLPPTDPDEPVRLAMLALRWDEYSGWQESHRPLDPRWDEELLREHLAAYLVGVGYDLTVAAQVQETLSR